MRSITDENVGIYGNINCLSFRSGGITFCGTWLRKADNRYQADTNEYLYHTYRFMPFHTILRNSFWRLSHNYGATATMMTTHRIRCMIISSRTVLKSRPNVTCDGDMPSVSSEQTHCERTQHEAMLRAHVPSLKMLDTDVK